MDNKDIEIQTLKTKLENQDQRIQFLEKNWIQWTKSTNEIGRQVVAALLESLDKKGSQ